MPTAPTDDSALPFLWCAEAKPGEKDYHVAFRAGFDLSEAGPVEFRLLGATWFNAWLDGEWFAEGPARFTAAFPEYQTFTRTLPAGRHVLAIQVHHVGTTTRSLAPMEPFLGCTAHAAGRALALPWKCQRLGAYASQVRLVNCQLGFIEWCDTRMLPDWQTAAFDDASWTEPAAVSRPLGAPRPLTCAHPHALVLEPVRLASGVFVEMFGYERDDPPARFFLRDLAPAQLPPQGIWRRYDLGRVRLMRPRFELEAPAGTVIEFAYSEALNQGRVNPWITLSTSDSCNLDHYVARGGLQEFSPLTPRGGRFLEVHVFAPAEAVVFHRETIVERTYYDAAGGTLRTGDALLDRIWSVGVETHRACAEDALTDNPTRERGQWAGDVVTVGMDIAAVAFADLRMCRRGLIQCAQCAREDGLVAGLCPGDCAYLTTYAAQWVTACLHYWELTGDRALLEEMLPAAERNVAAFAAQLTPDGLNDAMAWGFVDWGYVRNPGPSDMGVNLHVVAAMRDLGRWCDVLGQPDRAALHRQLADRLGGLVARYFAGEFQAGSDVWARIGYHRTALGLRLGFFGDELAPAGRAFLKAHMLRCFPNNPNAPRLSDPAANHPQLITPYFGHFALPELIEHGDIDFVLGQYRTCWGWSLQDGRTTWLEVFDTRWSHCHQWAGCPTWQLSRNLLGLRPRFDRGDMHFDLALHTGSLPQAAGAVPLTGRSEVIKVSWAKDSAGLHYRLETPRPLTLRLAPVLGGGTVEVAREFTTTLPVVSCR
ncbi:MAG: family 78 glycoside hydrolase catalytic domain [Opitutales bacterium]